MNPDLVALAIDALRLGRRTVAFEEALMAEQPDAVKAAFELDPQFTGHTRRLLRAVLWAIKRTRLSGNSFEAVDQAAHLYRVNVEAIEDAWRKHRQPVNELARELRTEFDSLAE
jgi:hypothetical protein